MDADHLDRYYTPAATADRVIAAADLGGPQVCADSACGEGSLLLAAERVWGNGITCIGVDKDRSAIRRLRRKNPNWILSVADVLKPSSATRARAIGPSLDCDALVLNPPFSMRDRKSVAVEYRSVSLRASVAMAHILRSIELYHPRAGVVAVVPESMLFSEVDAAARGLLGSEFELRVLDELTNTTFRGARANAAVIQLAPLPGPRAGLNRRSSTLVLPPFRLIRGGLPLFEAKGLRGGLPLVHSTDLEKLAATGETRSCRRVRAIGRGVVSGAVVLLPRVGLPRLAATQAVFLRNRVQLSDCVLALSFADMARARNAANLLARSWAELESLYRGTGARYVTVQRLNAWLAAAADWKPDPLGERHVGRPWTPCDAVAVEARRDHVPPSRPGAS